MSDQYDQKAFEIVRDEFDRDDVGGLRSAIAKALREATTPIETGWRDIESAPKTSRHILVWTPGNQCSSLVTWDRSQTKWRHAFGGYGLTDDPTYWMPLPAPPEPDHKETRSD